MMKKLLIINIILAVLIGGFVLVQMPLIKIRTEEALLNIEEVCLPGDLNPEERDRFDFHSHWILSNKRQCDLCRSRLQLAGLALALLLVINNVGILSFVCDKEKALNKAIETDQ